MSARGQAIWGDFGRTWHEFDRIRPLLQPRSRPSSRRSRADSTRARPKRDRRTCCDSDQARIRKPALLRVLGRRSSPRFSGTTSPSGAWTRKQGQSSCDAETVSVLRAQVHARGYRRRPSRAHPRAGAPRRATDEGRPEPLACGPPPGPSLGDLGGEYAGDDCSRASPPGLTQRAPLEGEQETKKGCQSR